MFRDKAIQISRADLFLTLWKPGQLVSHSLPKIHLLRFIQKNVAIGSLSSVWSLDRNDSVNFPILGSLHSVHKVQGPEEPETDAGKKLRDGHFKGM